jgi:hypothetical protein
MVPHGRSTPEAICPRCSKPIIAGTAAQHGGHAVHMRCLATASQLRAIEQQDRASRTRKQAEALVRQASELTEQARAWPWLCPVCDQRLRTGGGLLFQGDALVHATCWRELPSPPSGSAPGAGSPDSA